MKTIARTSEPASEWASILVSLGDDDDKSAVLDEAYEEYCRLYSAHHAPPASEFCDRYPRYQSSLRRLLEVHQCLHEHGITDRGDQLSERQHVDLSDFELCELLGRGAFADVYLAREKAVGGREVVLKVSWQGADEPHLLGRLNHPGIVQVHSAARDAASGALLLCMPYLGRITCSDVLDARYWREEASTSAERHERSAPHVIPAKGHMLCRHVAEFGIQLAEALAHAHERGVLHLDIKPSNILVAESGPILLDFNLSADASHGQRAVAGTIPYMAPEQLISLIEGRVRAFDGRADVFSLGVVLFELLAGRYPFGTIPSRPAMSDRARALLVKHKLGPRWPTSTVAEVDAPLRQIVEKCLHANPAQRYASASELARDLRHYRGLKQRAWRFLVRRRLPITLSTFGVMIFAALAWTYSATLPRYEIRQLALAIDCLSENRPAACRDAAANALAVAPNLVGARFVRGIAYQRLGMSDLAVLDLELAHRQRPYGVITAARAYAGHKHAAPGLTAEFYKMAIREGFRSAIVYNNLGASQIASGDLDGAEQSLDEALRIDNTMGAGFHNRARLRYRQHLRDSMPLVRAIHDIERAIELCQPSGELFWAAADMHAESGEEQDRKRAVEYVLKSLQYGLDPKTIEVTVNLKPFLALPHVAEAARTSRPNPTLFRAKRILDPVPDVRRMKWVYQSR